MPGMKSFFIIPITLVFLLGCGDGREPGGSTMRFELMDDLDALKGITVFFGHQSVGRNILDGVEGLLNQHNRTQALPITMLDSGPQRSEAFILHSRIGKNQDPISKCDDFYQTMHRGLGEKVDMALFKFCYIDVNSRTDIEYLFDYYKNTMLRLKEEFSSVRFIHATVPLRTSPDNLGVALRELLGRKNMSKADNQARNAFNQLLTSSFQRDPVFDIAGLQSTYPDGRRDFFRQDNAQYPRLIEAYTDDGGHLNAVGRKWVAGNFITLLAAAATQP